VRRFVNAGELLLNLVRYRYRSRFDECRVAARSQPVRRSRSLCSLAAAAAGAAAAVSLWWWWCWWWWWRMQSSTGRVRGFIDHSKSTQIELTLPQYGNSMLVTAVLLCHLRRCGRFVRPARSFLQLPPTWSMCSSDPRRCETWTTDCEEHGSIVSRTPR